VAVDEVFDRESMSRSEWPRDIEGLLAAWRFVARADPHDSEFFETNNAGPVLSRHRIRFSQNRTIAYRDGALEDAFADCMDQARNTIFLSYRWRECRRFALALARHLRNSGLSPWLDALSIPDYEVDRESGVEAPRLKELLRLGIEKSRWAVVINTETYAQKGWTSRELQQIRALGIPCFEVMRRGITRRCDGPRIRSSTSEKVAQEILQRCDQRARI
jgi:hypothetical protein